MKPNRRTVIGAILAIFCLSPIVAVIHAEPVEDHVKEIRSRYNAIEGAKLPSKKVEFEAQDEPLYASCTLYSRGDEVVKVHLSYGGDHRGSDEYFYYEGGELFFAHASDGSWQFTGKTLANGEGETIDSVTEHRVYFAGGKAIRHLVKKASSKKPEQLPDLLAKAENRAVEDPARSASLLDHGSTAQGVKAATDLERLFTAAE